MIGTLAARLAVALIVVLSFAGVAAADPDDANMVSLDTFSVRVDLRGYLTQGERSWLDGGFGKTRFGDGDSLEGGLVPANVALIWEPQLPFDLSAHVHAQANPDQRNGVDLVEAYLKWKPVPTSERRFSARAGTFFPPVSLENDGIAWTPTRTITASAINSWVGEDVLVLGVEGTVRTLVRDNELTLTGAVFRNNDTSGALLAYRGWALHDSLATEFGGVAIPVRSAAWKAFLPRQAAVTEPTREVDGRYGSYVRLQWALPAPVTLDALYYDNHANPEVVADGQYGWRTRFVNTGLSAALDDDSELLAQYMTGETAMGPEVVSGARAVDVGFSAAYVLLSRSFATSRLSGRADWFETRDRTFQNLDNNAEKGWSATLAYSFPVKRWVRVAVEGSYVSSKRAARIDQGIDPWQDQFLLQAALQFDLK